MIGRRFTGAGGGFAAPRLDAADGGQHFAGGGERSALWNQIKADALQTSVTRIADSHGAPMGAAMIAGVGVGAIRALPDAASKWITLGQTVRPNRKRAVHYDRRRAVYERLLKVLDGILT